jgi:hypothetical protein
MPTVLPIADDPNLIRSQKRGIVPRSPAHSVLSPGGRTSTAGSDSEIAGQEHPQQDEQDDDARQPADVTVAPVAPPAAEHG